MKLTRLSLCLLTLMFSFRLVADGPAPLPPGYNGTSADNPAYVPPGGYGPTRINSGVAGGPNQTPVREAPAFTKIIPSVDFDQLPLDQVIMALQQHEPDFQAVIRYSGDSQDSPPVKLLLKNVTVPQVLDVLSKKYSWGIEPVKAAGHPPIYVIAVRSPKHTEWSVSAYCLTPIIDQLEQRNEPNLAGAPIGGNEFGVKIDENAVKAAAQKADEMRKKYRSTALADVVATVDTAVKMASDGEAVMIQVHEPTEMLIMRTGPKQREAAERVLKALDPGNTVVKAEGPDFAHRAQPWFSGGAGSSSSGNVDPLIAREIDKMLETQENLEGTGDKAEGDVLRRLYEKRIRELQQELAKQASPARIRELQQELAKHASPAPATQPHEVPPAPPKN